jgi:hypothetical protein
MHALSEIRSHNLNKRAAADLRLRPQGPWNGQYVAVTTLVPRETQTAHLSLTEEAQYQCAFSCQHDQKNAGPTAIRVWGGNPTKSMSRECLLQKWSGGEFLLFSVIHVATFLSLTIQILGDTSFSLKLSQSSPTLQT